MQNRIRIKSTEGDARPAIDIFTNRSPAFYRANQLAIEVGVFDRKGELSDMNDVTGVRLKLMTAGPEGGPGGEPPLLYWDELVEAEDFEIVTEPDWKDGSAAHVTFTLSPEQTALADGSWWVWCVTEGDVVRTLFAGKFICREDGSGSGEITEAEPLQVLRDEAIQAAEDAATALATIQGIYADVVQDKQAAEDAQQQAQVDAQAASDHATAAGNSADAAAADAANAEASKQAAEAALEDFEKKYLGPFAAAPTTDNQGGPLLEGALYFDTVSKKLRSWSSAAWHDPINGVTEARAAELAAKPFGPALYCSRDGYVELPISPADLSGQSFTFVWCGRLTEAPASSGVNIVLGTARGVSTYVPGGVALAYSVNAGWNFRNEVDGASAQTVYEQTQTPLAERVTVAGVYDAATGTASLYINGSLVGTEDWSASADFSSSIGMALMAAQTNIATIDSTRSCGGYTEYCGIFDRVLSAGEIENRYQPQPITSPLSLGDTYQTGSLSGLTAWAQSSNAGYQPDSITSANSASFDINSSGQPVGLYCGISPWLPQMRVRVEFDLTVNSGTLPAGSSVFLNLTSSLSGTTTAESSLGAIAEGHNVVELVATASSDALTRLAFFFNAGTYGISVTNLTAKIVGCVFSYTAAQDSRNGFQLHDHSGNRPASHGLLSATGCTWTEPNRQFSFSWTRSTSGFLGDSDRPVLPPGFVIEEVIWEDSKGTKTTGSLGYSAAAPAVHVASWTPTQFIGRATLATGSPSVTDQRLYLAMSANAGAVTIHVKGRILS